MTYVIESKSPRFGGKGGGAWLGLVPAESVTRLRMMPIIVTHLHCLY